MYGHKILCPYLLTPPGRLSDIKLQETAPPPAPAIGYNKPCSISARRAMVRPAGTHTGRATPMAARLTMPMDVQVKTLFIFPDCPLYWPGTVLYYISKYGTRPYYHIHCSSIEGRRGHSYEQACARAADSLEGGHNARSHCCCDGIKPCKFQVDLVNSHLHYLAAWYSDRHWKELFLLVLFFALE